MEFNQKSTKWYGIKEPIYRKIIKISKRKRFKYAYDWYPGTKNSWLRAR